MGAAQAFSDTISHVADVVSDDIITPVVDSVSDVTNAVTNAALGAIQISGGSILDTVSHVGDVVVKPVIDTAVDAWHAVSAPVVDTQLGRLVLNIATQGQAAPLLAAYDISQGADPTKAITNAALNYVGAKYISPEISSALGGGSGANIVADALVGGTKASIQGGDFLTGAAIGGVTSGIDEAKLAAAEEYLQSLPGGHGEYNEATSPTEADVIEAISTTPDQAVAAQPSDQMQILYDQYVQMGMSGEEALNQVISDMGPEFTSEIDLYKGMTPEVTPIYQNQQPSQGTNISEQLAGLDATKAIAPIAIGALLTKIAEPTNNGNPENYTLVPIPSDWTSTVSNQQFIPSAPIDFGSPELLRGTQWEKYINPSITDVINTINYQQPSQFSQYILPAYQSVPDINQVIGNLNNAPVSINDIISGITSGQTNAG